MLHVIVLDNGVRSYTGLVGVRSYTGLVDVRSYTGLVGVREGSWP